MPYGTIKVDTITFTSGSSDVSIPISGLVQNPTFTGNVTVTGTVSGTVIRGNTVSGATVTGTAGQFAALTGDTAGFTTITGTTVTGTTANFATVSGTTVTGATARFTTTTGVSGVFTSQLSGATITGDTFQGSNITGVSGVFTTRVSGATVTGNAIVGSTITGVSGVFTTVISGASGIIAGNITASAFIPTGSAVPTNGVYLPSANTVGIAANGAGVAFVTTSGIQSSGFIAITASSQTETVLQNGLQTAGDGLILWYGGQTTSGNLYFKTQALGQPGDRAVLTTSGSLGLGTTSPGHRIDVVSTSGIDAVVRTRTTGNSSAGFVGSMDGGSTGWFVGPRKDATGGSSGTERFNILYGTTNFATIDTGGRLTMPNIPAFRAGGNANPTIAPSALWQFPLVTGTGRYNNGGHYSTTTYKFTAPVNGYYYFRGQVIVEGVATNTNCTDLITMYLNTTLVNYSNRRAYYITNDTGAGAFFVDSISAVLNLSVNDTVDLRNGNGNSFVQHNNTSYMIFEGFLIG